MEPELFGRYRLDELIGRGGMGEVYRAFDTVTRRTVAIKRLPRHLAADVEFQARFRRESALAAWLDDPHVIPIHNYGEIDEQLFIDMRLVRGTDLATLLAEQGPLAPAPAVEIVTQVAEALDAAHAAGLAHRDVKPSNVLITDNHRFVYLADFGIARSLEGEQTALTATGITVGTLDYMAPERFTADSGDHLVDVYALACLLYQVLTATKPFLFDNQAALMHAHLTRDPPRLSASRPDLPAALDTVVTQGMAKNPAVRYSTAGHLATAAQAALTTPPAPAKIPAGAFATPRWAPSLASPSASSTIVPPIVTPKPANLPPLTPAEPGIPTPKPPLPRRPPAQRHAPALPRIRQRTALIIVGILIAVAASLGIVLLTRTPDPTIIAIIDVDEQPNGVAITPDGRHAYITNSRSGTVSVIEIPASLFPW